MPNIPEDSSGIPDSVLHPRIVRDATGRRYAVIYTSNGTVYGQLLPEPPHVDHKHRHERHARGNAHAHAHHGAHLHPRRPVSHHAHSTAGLQPSGHTINPGHGRSIPSPLTEDPDERRIRELAIAINRDGGSVGSGVALAEFFGASLAIAGVIVLAPLALSAGIAYAAETVGGYYATALGTAGVVLGRYPQYIEGAIDSIEMNALNLPPRLFSFFDYFGEGWTVNEAFLDRAIETGQEFYMASSVLGQEGKIFYDELQYLISRGIGPDLWRIYYFTHEMPTSPAF